MEARRVLEYLTATIYADIRPRSILLHLYVEKIAYFCDANGMEWPTPAYSVSE